MLDSKTRLVSELKILSVTAVLTCNGSPVVSFWWWQVSLTDLQITCLLTLGFRVTNSNLGTCLNSPAYMCFYVKRHLDYKPDMTPTYVQTRENEAVREKELEKEKERARNKEVEDALLATVWVDRCLFEAVVFVVLNEMWWIGWIQRWTGESARYWNNENGICKNAITVKRGEGRDSRVGEFE